MSGVPSEKGKAMKRKRKTLKRMYSDEVWGFRQFFITLTARQRGQLEKQIESLSETNCGWAEYWMKDISLRFIRDLRQSTIASCINKNRRVSEEKP